MTDEASVKSTPSNRRGRPKSAPLAKQQRHVAKRYQDLLNVRQQFDLELKQHYPNLNPAELSDVAQIALATAEEYRLWSEIDNQLLAIQRHKDPETQLVLQLERFQQHLVQLQTTYQLILSQRNQPVLPSKIYWRHASSETINNAISYLSSHSANQQTVTLYGFALWLKAQCVESDEKNGVKTWRTLIRKVLGHIIEKRIGLVYPIHNANTAGRPKLPTPVDLVRAEQALIDDYQELAITYRTLQILPLTPEQVWRNQQHSIFKKVGRKPLTKHQKALRKQSKLEEQLRELERNKEAILATESERHTVRGRKPLTYQQLRSSLLEKIQALTELSA
ncbi:hypothetical protein [Vibrio crassostreae]|uniref:Uncharacterized protein n=1 Tax=Vibrio crassostreae TaxID=246167 RepID=A0A4R2GF84_9VIBR|nr:hypothetical protein [Vibrio crassostreae]MDH5949673.1 hypothetical protein [Vibrio crassostreae]ROP22185.1 hypothetical protein EDB33_10421 [Vibrio crassostreae]ROP23280.1 hypothetical protein EDB34_10421 [Vibrio crassostreae]ROR84532.1 hypothetical protein EDB55_2536 [Vibrio crassostreae]RPE98185.1 hypothetical protein EDB15_104257 [Vibrio crassostreae]